MVVHSATDGQCIHREGRCIETGATGHQTDVWANHRGIQVGVSKHKSAAAASSRSLDKPVQHQSIPWWKDNQPQYTRLAQLAKRLLCVQVSSAPSERNF